MNFEFNEEQVTFREMVDRLTSEQYSFEIRRQAILSKTGWDREFWRMLGELGILGAPFSEETGGLDGGPIMTMIIMQAFGRRLVISPYLYTVICAGRLLALSGTENQKAIFLPKIISGQETMAFACSEHGDLGDIAKIQTTATRHAYGYRITGRKALVIGVPWCDHIMVIAKLPDGRNGAFIVPRDAEGVIEREFPTIDGYRAAEISFNDVLVSEEARVGGQRAIDQDIERAIDEATVAACAEVVGSVEAMLAMTVEYAKTRKQFGRPIGEFQVLQHRMVDMHIASEQCSSIVHHATLCLEEDPATRQRAVSAAKVHVGRAGRSVARAAVQIHGGMGIMEEVELTHHFRRIEVFNMQFGTIADHAQRYARLLAETGTQH